MEGVKVKCGRTTYKSGIHSLYGSDITVDEFASMLADEVRSVPAAIVSIFFSQDRFAADDLAAAIDKHMPDLHYVACSTAGEITPAGYLEGQILAIIFPDNLFSAASAMIEDLSLSSMETAVDCVKALRREMEANDRHETSDMFGVLLIDGLSRCEDEITSALYWSFDDIPLIGGSAGDNLRFEKTTLILSGKVRSDAAIVILMRSKIPFIVFKTDNFTPTSQKLVVTASVPDERRVLELNGETAAKVYAEAVGTDQASLGPRSFASYPLVVRVGGEYFCRSIQKHNPDGSLSFFCAIDNGVVLTIAQPKGMVDTTRERLRDISQRLGGIDVVLGFDCVLRRLDAQNRQSFRAISALYAEQHIIGFGTYGEQYRSMHINQTLTGIAFGMIETTSE